ncbi:outer membrane transporter [Catenovulum agarivorans DS-2]|uniref:Outer membrane transporter n=1 Tax=Catenovulum agarivorans DS-2 TaxID=1328313 RepID=W7QH38_9ALTE|nr:efflux transporter outer membrane subunit [Catenovulum agarivorans]EWH12254.1 outer membrane transporter [Catenovulum agarivorans DS-2]
MTIKIDKCHLMTKKLLTIGVCAVLAACQQTSEYQLSKTVNQPDAWQTSLPAQENAQAYLHLADWLKSPVLKDLLTKALQDNFDVQLKRLELEKAQQRLVQAGSNLWPDVNLAFSSSRNSGNSTNHNLSVNANYEVDIWGKLSRAEQIAQLNYQKAKIDLQNAELNLVSQLTQLWFTKAAQVQTYQLLQKRFDNVQSNLDIIENGYKSGLNSALDVYLTRNSLESEKSTLVSQQQAIEATNRRLQLLLGEYPSKYLQTDIDLTKLDYQFPTELPSDLIKARPDVQQAWINVLIDDASLAIAHKNRFPSISLRASVSDSQSSLADLFSGSLAWSIAASVSQPLFRAGELKAAQMIADLNLQQSEVRYVQALYNAFESVELALAEHESLRQRLIHSENSKINAEKAEQLAFEQYLAGISSYSTYLEAQRRAFNANTQVISLKRDIILNQIKLHQALGGDYTIDKLQGDLGG